MSGGLSVDRSPPNFDEKRRFGHGAIEDDHTPSYQSTMTLLAHAMLILFVIAWLVALGAWFYGTCFFLPMWVSRFQKPESRKGYGRKALKGYGIFVGAVIFGFIVGGIAQLAGGWGQ